MRRMLLSRWSMRLAALLRRVVSALDRLSGAPDPRMAALAARYPGAPEHWLRHIANRAPHLAETMPPPPPPTEARRAEARAQRAEPPPPLHLAPHGHQQRRTPLALVEARQAAPTPPPIPRAEREARPPLRVLAERKGAAHALDVPAQPRPGLLQRMAAMLSETPVETARRAPVTQFPARTPHAPHAFETVPEARPARADAPSLFPQLPRARAAAAFQEPALPRRAPSAPDIPDDGVRWPSLPDIDEALLESLIDPPRFDELRREQEQGLWSA
jgi:hypothetical protein